ncbi:E3 ubiquitin/ISG15 ligase TRIM25 [Oncorhynchus tshawytscha]|uniref:E3 ubiquitin/ISG15 ligase TRIM25 n=1 Tax=Oncorhynchus tshawytscha TaxID=74940 RepID=UPI000D0A4C59|nr:E3 ubiquitin/ISG15 ligase TRIM25 [Oncorhynchus tshawytscha]
MPLSKPEKLLEHELSCPICLQLYTDPVYLPCGHNYCLACIQKATDVSGGEKSLPQCPECREEYGGTETLQRNFKLCGIIEGYKAVAPADHLKREPLKVRCDHCLDLETLAIKTCLKCEVSLCARHLQHHTERESFRTHDLVEPQTELGQRGCAIHGRLLEYFCASDMTSLCANCFIEGTHQNHDVLTFEAAEEEMRRALEIQSKAVANRLQLTETLLQRAAEDQGTSEAVGDKLLSKSVDLMDSMAGLVSRYKDRMSLLLEKERGHQRESWQSGLGLLEEQKQQLMEAHQRTTEALTETEKCLFINRFLLIEPQLREVMTGTVARVPNKVPLNPKRLQASLRMEDFRAEMARLLQSLHVLLNPLELTFNLSTAHTSLLLSNDLQTVKYSGTKQAYADNPERFSTAPQVLCSQGFTSGEHIWVVEVGDQSMWSVGLCYKSMPRRGDHSRLGHNPASWRLQWKNKKLTACHASSNVALAEMANQPLRVEVALDYEGGTLIFHSTKDRREHLHTFRAVFREAVYPAFSILSTREQSWITLQSGV